MTEQNDNNQLLEIYKLHAELADRVSQRREGANRLYVSILTAFFVAVIYVVKQGKENEYLLLGGGLLGMGVCISWYIIIRSYRQLNSGKFAVLGELENQLPYKFFQQEWEILKGKENSSKYWQLTTAENILPSIFGVAYLFLSILSICGGKILP